MKRPLKIIMASLIAGSCISAVAVSLSKQINLEINEVNATAVTYTGIAWNDYIAAPLDSRNIAPIDSNLIPTEGYAALVQFSANLSNTEIFDVETNMATSEFDIGNKMTVNGVPMKDIDGSVIYYYAGMMFFYIPDAKITYSGDYYRPTVEIEENTIYFDSLLPSLKLEYVGTVGTANGWQTVEATTYTVQTSCSIWWNNVNYDNDRFGSKKLLMLNFGSNISSFHKESEISFNIYKRNYAKTTLGNHTYLNGTPFSQIENAEIFYYAAGIMGFYVPNMGSVGNTFTIDANQNVLTSTLNGFRAVFTTANKWEEAKQVTFSQINWNNVIYTKTGPTADIPANANNIPTQGYSFLISFSDDLGAADNNNLANANYDAGNRILINGVPSKNVSGAMINRYLGGPYLFVYFPESGISYTGTYDRPTVEITEGTVVGNAQLPYKKFIFTSGIGYYNVWTDVEPTAYEVSFSNIGWNNTGNEIWADKEGILLVYSPYLSSIDVENNTAVNTRNLARTSFGQNLYLNGTPFSSIPGAEINYRGIGTLWLYAPNMNNNYNGGYASLRFTGARLFDAIIPGFSFEFNGSIWIDASSSNYYTATYTGIANIWNNINTYCAAGYRDTILAFDKNLGVEPVATNFAEAAYDIGNKMTINGVPVKNISGIHVGYNHGYNYLYINYVESILIPSNGYSITTLHIPAGTQFINKVLSDVTLYMHPVSNEWIQDASDLVINTEPEATFVKNGNYLGLKFETHLDYGTYNSFVASYGKENIEIGTYIIPEKIFKNSRQNLVDYLNSHNPSSTTYAVVKNQNNDFVNENTAEDDGHYTYYGSMIKMNEKNYALNYIGVGYIKVGESLFLGNDGSESTNFYKVLTRAYLDGVITDKSYFASSINFTTDVDQSYVLSDASINTTNHTVEYSRAGFYKVTASSNIYTITIDGEPTKVNIPSGSTRYITSYNGTVQVRTTSALQWGIGEPTMELFNTISSRLTTKTDRGRAANVAAINGAFGCDTQRLWLNLGDLCFGGVYKNNDGRAVGVDFDQEQVQVIHNVIQEFKNNGINDIIMMVSGIIHDWSVKNCYSSSTGQWYRLIDVWHNEAPSDATFHSVIPYDNEEEYQQFINTQQEIYDALMDEFGSEITSMETMNECDCGSSLYYRRYFSNSECPNQFASARWAMDVNRAAMKAVMKYAPHVRVFEPAMMCVGSIANIRPLKTSAVFNEYYSYINTYGTGDSDDYFNEINMHPYVFPDQDTVGDEGVYLYSNGKTPSKKVWHLFSGTTYEYNPYDNTDYADDWVTYMNQIKAISNNYGDTYKPVAITEWGEPDWENEGVAANDPTWQNFDYNHVLSTIYGTIAEKAKTLNYLEEFHWFRMFQFNTENPQGYHNCWTEETMGIIDVNLNLKDRGKKIYQILNDGSTDYSAVNAAISRI